MPNELRAPSLPSFSTQEELEQLLLEGLNSGDPIDLPILSAVRRS